MSSPWPNTRHQPLPRVEGLEQIHMLQMLGCDVVQGYFFSHPLQVSEYEALLIDDRLPF